MCFVESGNPVLEVGPAHTRFLSKLLYGSCFRLAEVFISNVLNLQEIVPRTVLPET